VKEAVTNKEERNYLQLGLIVVGVLCIFTVLRIVVKEAKKELDQIVEKEQ